MTSDIYLNLKEAARYLGVSDIKIRNLISKGLLKVSLDPLDDRKRLVKRSELDTLKTPHPVEGATTKHQIKRSRNPVQERKGASNRSGVSNES